MQEHLRFPQEAPDTPNGNQLEGHRLRVGFRMPFIQLREHLSGFHFQISRGKDV